MDLRKIKKLIELLEESALSEMEISEGDNSIRLSRASSTMNMQAVMPAPVAAQAPQQAATAPVVDANNVAASAEAASGTPIESPMVGTFYDAPSPDSDPFVKVGSKIQVGDVLCVIEAMKTFNQIESEVTGTITAIHKSAGDPVEFGEPLFTIS